MEQALADLVQRRVVKLDEALTRTSRPDQFIGVLERAGFDVESAMRAEAQPAGLGMGL
jgi:hypothetical protein